MANGKGSSWERDISRFLTKWITGQDKDLYVWRSPGSGGLATKIANFGNKVISGDVIALRPEAAVLLDVFSVECKNGYPGADPFKCIMSTKGDDLKDFWTQACRDADRAEKLPMLIFKKKGVRGNPFVGVCDRGLKKFKVDDLESLSLNFSKLLPVLHMFDLDKFFSTISYKDFK